MTGHPKVEGGVPPLNRGSVLLVSLAILAVLSMFTLSLVRITSLERQASSNYKMQAHARLAAEAGVSHAIAHARDGIRLSPWESGWWIDGTKVGPYVVSSETNGRVTQYEVECFDVGSRMPVNNNTPNVNNGRVFTSMGVPSPLAGRSPIFTSRKALVAAMGGPGTAGIDWVTAHDTPVKAMNPGGMGVTTGEFLPWEYNLASADGRGMVNINGAPVEVLTAVFDGLSGYPIDLGATASGTGSNEWLNYTSPGTGNVFAGSRVEATTGTAEIMTKGEATALAGQIKTERDAGRPIKSWEDLWSIVKASGLSVTKQGLVMAIAGPDNRVMGYNPDATRRRTGSTLCDKASLSAWAAELTLGPSGVFEIRTRGWVEDADGVVIAEAFRTRTVRLFTPMHYGSQIELESLVGTLNDEVYQSMPEPDSAVKDSYAGHIRLTTEWTGDVLAGDTYSTNFRGLGTDSAYYKYIKGGGANLTDPLAKGGVFGPEGQIVWRKAFGSYNSKVRGTTSLPDGLAEDGSCEFWIKFADDLSANGTDEVLLTITVSDKAKYIAAAPDATDAITGYAVPSKVGATIKIERFGNEIRAAWFFWGSGTGAVSGYELTLMDNKGVVNWKGGEWHHIKVDWNVTTQDWVLAVAGEPNATANPLDKIELYLDNVPQTRYGSELSLVKGPEWLRLEDIFLDDLVAGNLNDEFILEPNGDITKNVFDADGALIDSSLFMEENVGNEDYDDLRDDIVGGIGNGDIDDGEQIFSGKTKRNVQYHLGKIASIPNRTAVHVGGFVLTPGTAVDIHDTGQTNAGVASYRFPNATIDDVAVFDDKGVASGKPANMRYAKNDGSVLPTESFSVSVPLPASDTPGRLEIACVTANFEQPAGTTVSATLAGSSWSVADPLWSNVGAASTMSVTLRGDGTKSPTLENITVYVLHPPEVLEDDETAGD